METCEICGGELEWVNCPACEGEGGHVDANGEWTLCEACEGEEGHYACLSSEHEKPWLRPEPVGGVWLMREGDYVTVYVEREDGKYYLAIREVYDSNFSHNITAEGIRQLDEQAPWNESTDNEA